MALTITRAADTNTALHWTAADGDAIEHDMSLYAIHDDHGRWLSFDGTEPYTGPFGAAEEIAATINPDDVHFIPGEIRPYSTGPRQILNH